MSSKLRHDGELEIDCRASPGLPAEVSIPAGLVPVRAGGIYHGRTMTCWHCGGVVNINELRVRPREYCRTCDMYICDFCHEARCEPDYVHLSFKDKADAVRSGKFIWVGSASRGTLVPVFKET